MNVFALFCMLITTSGWINVTFGLSLSLDSQVVDNYMNNVQFIKNIMIQDRLWLPILKEKVIMDSPPRRHLDHFMKPSLSNNENQMIVINPLNEIVTLLMSKSMIGTEVSYFMAVIRRSISCYIMKHVSMQGFLLHQLILLNNKSYTMPYVLRWLEHMVRMSIDKLVAVNQKLPVMAKMYSHIKSLLNPNFDLTNNELNVISQDMLRVVDSMCATSNKQGHYRSLITELKKSMTNEELYKLDVLMYDEHLKGLTELNNIKEIQKYHGSLTIDEDVDPAGFGNLDGAELKKLLTINKTKMNYTLLNIPIKSLAMPQLKYILDSQQILALHNKK